MENPEVEYVLMDASEADDSGSGKSSLAHPRASLCKFAGLTLALVGSAVLTGWLLGLPSLKSVRPGWPSMQANSALGFLLSGISLSGISVLLLPGRQATRWAVRMSRVCAGAAALIGLLTVAEVAGGWEFGIDNLLFADSLEAGATFHPGRMGVNAASALVLGNAALLLLTDPADHRLRLAAAGSLSILTLLLGLLGATKYILGIAPETMSMSPIGMALHSACAFIVLGSAGLGISWIKCRWRGALATPIVAASAFGMLMLIGVSLELSRNTRASASQSQWLVETQDLQGTISELNAGLAIALVSVGSFVISGREDYLERYDVGRKQVLDSELRLRNLTADSSVQKARMITLHAQLARQFDVFNRTVEARRIDETERAMRLISSRDRQSHLEAIYATTGEIGSEAWGLLAQRKPRSMSSIERTLSILSTSSLLGLGLILGALLYLNTGAIDRQSAAAEVATSEARYRSLVVATSQIVWATDANGQVQRPQPSWQAYTGQSDDEIMGSGWANALHPDDIARGRAGWIQAVATHSVFETEYRIRRHDGIYRVFSARGAAVYNSDGSVREWIRTCTDITDRRKAETERERQELEHRVVERTEQLEEANRELEAFSYSVSHDLRAPLRGIDSFSRMIIDDYGSKLDVEGRRMLNVVRSESQRMGQLIDDLLAFSRVGRMAMRFQTIDMTALVEEVIDNLRLPSGRRQDIALRPLPQARGDRNLIEQVWVNLLSNAIKFTSHQQVPVIEVGASSTDGVDTYYVKDNGAGFDPRYTHKLFGVFQRLHSEEEFAGTGVGLALVQRIVHRHGGSVRAEGEVNKGATFYFSLGNAGENQS